MKIVYAPPDQLGIFSSHSSHRLLDEFSVSPNGRVLLSRAGVFDFNTLHNVHQRLAHVARAIS